MKAYDKKEESRVKGEVCEYPTRIEVSFQRIEKQDKKFIELKDNMDGTVDVYECMYNYRHDENGICTYSFPRQRIVRNCETSYWTCIVHELLNVKNDISEETDIVITHTSNHENSKRYIDYFEIKINKGHKLSSREKFFYGGELMFTGEKEKALPYLEDFINDKTYDNIYELSRGHNYLGMYYQDNGKYIKAINHYLNQISYNSPDMETYYNIANCYNGLSDFENAKFYFEAILSLKFNKEKFMNGSESDINNLEQTVNEFKINSLLFLCVIYYNEGDIDKAIECNSKVLLIDKTNKSACFNDEYFKTLQRGE